MWGLRFGVQAVLGFRDFWLRGLGFSVLGLGFRAGASGLGFGLSCMQPGLAQVLAVRPHTLTTPSAPIAPDSLLYPKYPPLRTTGPH